MTKDKARKRATRQRMVELDERYTGVVAPTPHLLTSESAPAEASTLPEKERIEREWWFVRWPCLDGCQSEYQVLEIGSASMVSCIRCSMPVCVDCQVQPVEYEGGRCRDCVAELAALDRPPRPTCLGRCITQAQAWDDAHPGEFHDHSDSATGLCDACDLPVCVHCRAAEAKYLFGVCGECEQLEIDEAPPEYEPWDRGVAAELQRLVGQIVSAGGGPFPHINRWVNRQMGVRRRREADAGQLAVGVDVAGRWLASLRTANERNQLDQYGS